MYKPERVFSWMIHPVVIVLYVVALVLCYIYFDKVIAVYFYQMDLRQFAWLSVVSLLGKWQIASFLLFIIALYFHFFRPKSVWKNRSWFLFLCVIITNILASVLKLVLGRARPDLWIDAHLYGFYWFKFHRPYWSFPSGHTTTIFSLVAGLSIIFPRYLWLFFIAGLCIVSTRILLYHHYLSDVLSTLYLTVIEVGLLKYFLNQKHALKI
ncbi:phosphatase PAP2 family protein [Legionella israelensis]|uniref:Phosphatidylglycerophosphatase B n=1 Tax=Legionella israelensis TaxID=454 RepID=A0A0W0VK68_9GAMM|nr:phosphatase PAP2 family protein [Legionella israelensis]KTD20512.1 phosphatidylglycerophosphatase B [Legionella israelensis]QBS10811.1 phosphatase PAP2 family protein [Legionella israelensis]SCX85984.1 PAP2 superfamily protein [Legionella israelensis DSM 19235]STX57787.1 phosphatidylglycerophosphatase B [Legionella israelensis]